MRQCSTRREQFLIRDPFSNVVAAEKLSRKEVCGSALYRRVDLCNMCQTALPWSSPWNTGERAKGSPKLDYLLLIQHCNDP
jgi:hypothetical protein